MLRNRLYRLRKTHPCNYDPAWPHILGNTIGNAVAQGVEEASNTAAHGQGGNGGGITAMQDPGPVQMAPIDTSALDSMNLQLVPPSGAGVGGEAGSVQVGYASGTQGSLKYDAVINVINGTAVVQSAPMVLGANGEFSPGNSDGGSFVITNTNGQTYQLGWNNSLDQSGNVTGRQFYVNGMPIGSANGSATSIALSDGTNINYTPPPITSNDSNEQIVVTGPPSACAQAISQPGEIKYFGNTYSLVFLGGMAVSRGQWHNVRTGSSGNYITYGGGLGLSLGGTVDVGVASSLSDFVGYGQTAGGGVSLGPVGGSYAWTQDAKNNLVAQGGSLGLSPEPGLSWGRWGISGTVTAGQTYISACVVR